MMLNAPLLAVLRHLREWHDAYHRAPRMDETIRALDVSRGVVVERFGKLYGLGYCKRNNENGIALTTTGIAALAEADGGTLELEPVMCGISTPPLVARRCVARWLAGETPIRIAHRYRMKADAVRELITRWHPYIEAREDAALARRAEPFGSLPGQVVEPAPKGKKRR